MGFLLIHPYLQQPPAQALFLQALSNGWALTLFRDELLPIHSYAQQFFEGLKGHGKRASEVKEALAQALGTAPLVHRERRKFLRSALKELALVLAEQPGLLGPKASGAFLFLAFIQSQAESIRCIMDGFIQIPLVSMRFVSKRGVNINWCGSSPSLVCRNSSVLCPTLLHCVCATFEKKIEV